MKYATITKFFDNGSVTSTIIETEDNAKSYCKYKLLYDLYFDVHETKEEAELFKKSALEC